MRRLGVDINKDIRGPFGFVLDFLSCTSQYINDRIVAILEFELFFKKLLILEFKFL